MPSLLTRWKVLLRYPRDGSLANWVIIVVDGYQQWLADGSDELFNLALPYSAQSFLARYNGLCLSYALVMLVGMFVRHPV